MTKEFQKELKHSKSADDITTSPANIPLKKSQSQLEIPLTNQPNKDQQITSLQDELTTERQRVGSLREDLANEQEKSKKFKASKEKLVVKVSELEDQILQLRLDKIKEFGDYWEKKQELTQELEENITQGTAEIERLEKKLIATNKKKLELAQKLGTSESKQAQLELQLINSETNPSSSHFWFSDYGSIILIALVYCWATWILSKNTPPATY